MLDTTNTSLLQSLYMVEMEKAKLDIEINGDYTREGLSHLSKAVELQLRLSALTKGAVSAGHKRAADDLIRLIVGNMQRLGLMESPEPQAKEMAPVPTVAAAEVPSAKQHAAPAAKSEPSASSNGELQGFDPTDFIVKPGAVQIEDAENAAPDVVAALRTAVYDDFETLFPNFKNYNPGAQVRHRMLYGPPGSGKTFLCKGLATYIDHIYPNNEDTPKNSAFFLLSCSETMSKYVGTAEHRIRAIFKAAEEYAFSVICIDEVDAMCPARSDDSKRVNYTTTFLELIDGVAGKTNSMVIMATNHPEKVDSAVHSRIGHLDFIDYPAAPALEDFLRRREDILPGLGDDEALREEMITMLAKKAEDRHFSFRNMNVLCSNLFSALRSKLLRLYPTGSSEITDFAALTREEIFKAIDGVASNFNQAEYDALREYHKSHGG